MLNAFRSRSNCEIEAKFIQNRINSVERNIAELCNVFAQYSRKAARVRDKGDEICKVSLNFAESETINKTLSLALENFAESFSTLSDYGDIRVQSIDSKVVSKCVKYEEICKHVKEELKDIYSARDKELNRRRQLDRIREKNPRHRQQIIQAETELVKASTEVSKIIHNLEEKTTSFEKQKLHDVKTILLDFIINEIGYHAKSLEVLTKMYNDVSSIDEEADLVELKNSLRAPNTIRHKSIPNPMFRSTGSLGSLGALFSSAHNKKIPGIPNSRDRLSKSEETLDSIKQSFSESEESDNETEENVSSSSDEKKSPTIVRKFKK